MAGLIECKIVNQHRRTTFCYMDNSRPSRNKNISRSTCELLCGELRDQGVIRGAGKAVASSSYCPNMGLLNSFM